jgi:hypothetical protein
MRVVTAIILMLAAGTGGYFYAKSEPPYFSMKFPDRGYKPSSMSLGCEAVAQGSAYENKLAGTANAESGPNADNLALSLSQDGKTLSILYAYDVSNGSTQPIQVHSKTASYIVAQGQQTLGETAVILDVQSLKAVVTYTGQGILGIKGNSYLLQCH